MVFFDLATGFFRRNARSEGAAEGPPSLKLRTGSGVWGEFRRARAFRRSEAEAVIGDSPQNEF